MSKIISVFRFVLGNHVDSGMTGAAKPHYGRWKLPILAVLGNLVLASTLFGQATQNTTIQPDCLIPFTLTAAGNFPTTTVTGGAGDNRTKGCAAWTLMYQNTGMTGVSVTLQSGSSPTTTVTFGSFAGTISTGFVNPIVSDTGGSLQAINKTADVSWVRVNVAATGTGTLTGVLYGFRNSSAAVTGGGGGAFPAGSAITDPQCWASATTFGVCINANFGGNVNAGVGSGATGKLTLTGLTSALASTVTVDDNNTATTVKLPNDATAGLYLPTSTSATPVAGCAQYSGTSTELTSAVPCALSSAPTLGAELVTNGGFTGGTTGWTLQADAVYGTNNVVCTYNGTGCNISQTTLSTTSGTTYLLQFTISAASNQGAVFFHLTNNGYFSPNFSNGVQKFSFLATNTGAETLTFLNAYATNGETWTITNVSFKPITSAIVQPLTLVGPSNGQELLLDDTNRNTSLGLDSLINNVSGSGLDNTAIGWRALQRNTTGIQNTAVGSEALPELIGSLAANNTAVGVNAGRFLTTGNSNTAVGTGALYAATGGNPNSADNNTAIGFAALQNNLIGSSNTAVGFNSLLSALGSGNVALGAWAGYYETGSNAFYVNNTDRSNTSGDKTKSLLYGTFNATAASQTLTVNGTLNATVIDQSGASTTAGLKIPAGAGAVPTTDDFLAFNTTNHTFVWGSNGTTMVGAIAATGTGTATTCTNQVITAVSSLAVPTCTGLTLASAQFANQGTTTTLLHGNGAGNPSFGNVVGGDFGSAITARTVLGNATASAAAPTFSTTADALAYQTAEIPAYVFVTSTFTTSGVGTALEAITGLTWTMPGSTALNIPFHCALVYHQNSGTAAVAFGFQNATTGATNLLTSGTINTSATVFAAANVANTTATTATSVVSGTPSAITTNWNAVLDGLIEQPSGTASVFTIRVSTATAADTVSVLRGSYCRIG